MAHLPNARSLWEWFRQRLYGQPEDSDILRLDESVVSSLLHHYSSRVLVDTITVNWKKDVVVGEFHPEKGSLRATRTRTNLFRRDVSEEVMSSKDIAQCVVQFCCAILHMQEQWYPGAWRFVLSDESKTTDVLVSLCQTEKTAVTLRDRLTITIRIKDLRRETAVGQRDPLESYQTVLYRVLGGEVTKGKDVLLAIPKLKFRIFDVLQSDTPKSNQV